MNRPQFVNDEIYHIYNRGVDKRKIFLEEKDYFRFINDLFEFNNEESSLHPYYRFPNYRFFNSGEQQIETAINKRKKPRKLLVEILAWCLMDNHYHLLIKQRKDKGIVNFMQKIGTGYTMYFNQKWERSGVLFESKFKAILIRDENHFFYLPFYIHANPLDFIEPDWRDGKLNNYQKAINYLESYRYSSYLDCIGKKNFPSVCQMDFLLEIFENRDNYKKQFEKWLKEMDEKRLKELKEVSLEKF